MSRTHWLIAALLALGLAACSKSPAGHYQGWIEADTIFVSPEEAGRVTHLFVREGDRVVQGTPLFELDDVLQRADLNQAQATLDNARQIFDRAQTLLKSGSGTQSNFDQAQAALRVAEAVVNTANTRLARRKVASPVAGTVQQVYFREGEMVSALRPLVAIVPPENIKLRFYVSEADLPKIKLGEKVNITCDGCASGLTASVSFIADSAEYTPPVIYSLEERAKLVFLIEARPDQPSSLRVGQPVSVSLATAPLKPAP